MLLKFEKAALRDLDSLQKIEKECFGKEAYTRDQLMYLLEMPDTINVTANKNHEIVGFIIGMIETYSKIAVGHIITIDVAAKNRRTGIGLKLLEVLEQSLQKRGVKTVYLEVRADNTAALGLYGKKGYTKLLLLRNYYSKDADALQMKKDLKK